MRCAHKKRKELRRQRKRLADTGDLTSTTTAEPAALTAALLDFLSLEAAGWKGRAGTAAKRNDAVRCFVVEAVTALAAEGKASVVAAGARRTRDRRHRDAALRRRRVVLEDRL